VAACEQDSFARAVECLAQARDMHLDDLRCARWRFVRPEVVDQAIGRDDLVRVEQEQGENGALLAAADIEHSLTFEHLEGPQDSKVHGFAASSGRS
jgi:hypothetical protein